MHKPGWEIWLDADGHAIFTPSALIDPPHTPPQPNALLTEACLRQTVVSTSIPAPPDPTVEVIGSVVVDHVRALKA